jgi:hypothetical protein
MRTRNNDSPPSPINLNEGETAFAVSRLTCSSGRNGRMEHNVDAKDKWNLDFCRPATPPPESDSDDSDNDDDSTIASEGSQVTIVGTFNKTTATIPRVVEVTPASPEPRTSTNHTACDETPPDIRYRHREKPADCHVLIR